MEACSAQLSREVSHRRILRAAATVAMASLLVKVAATAKEITVAGVFGRSAAIEAYLAAALIPALLVNLLSESMNQALIPTLIQVREREGHQNAQQLLSNAMLWSCCLLIGASAMMALVAPWIFRITASHFDQEKRILATHLFYALLPTIVLAGIASNCTAVLNTAGRFLVPAIAPITTSFAIIAGSMTWSSRLGIWVIIDATLIAIFLQTVGLVYVMRREGYCLSFRWYGVSDATRDVARQYGPILLSGVVASAGLIVDQAMAAALPAGSLSALAYAGRFVSVVVTLLAGAISSALTPDLSMMVVRRDWQECRRTVRRWSIRMALLSAPVAATVILTARTLVRITFERGNFGTTDTAAVAPVLALYAIQIPFFVCSRVPYRLVLAMRRSDLVLACGTLNLVLDIALNLVLMRWLGVAGIALATSIWCMTTWLFFMLWSNRLLRAAERDAV